MLSFKEHFYISRDSPDYGSFMAKFADIKKVHVMIVAYVSTYLTFRDVLTMSKVNRRLYFVTGDIPLLRGYSQPQN